MKRMLLGLLMMITTLLVGCDLFTTTQSSQTTTQDFVSQTTMTTAESMVDDVSFDVLFDDTIYKKFIIHFSEANFLQLIYDMENYHDEFGSYRDNTIQEVDITYSDGLGNVMEVREVGFRTKGNVFSRVLPVIKEGDEIVGYQQVAFQIEFNDTFDYPINSTQYNALKSREVFDLEQLNFKHVREGDYGAVTESVSYDLYREVGVVTSATSYAIVYFDIDGLVVPYGLFMLQEPIDDVFVERYFGKNQDGTIGDLYKCTWQTEPASLKAGYQSISLGISDYMEGFRRSYALKTNKEAMDFSSFTDFIALVNETAVADYYSLVASSLNIDHFARAMAMGFLIGSADDIRSNANNYYLYFNNGYAYYIPFDMDNALGWGWNPYGDYGISLDIDALEPSNYDWYGDKTDFVLVYNLLNDPTFITRYLDYLDAYTDDFGAFSYTTYSTEYFLIKDLYQDELTAFEHLGMTYFSLDSRWYPASRYFSDKSREVREQLTALGY